MPLLMLDGLLDESCVLGGGVDSCNADECKCGPEETPAGLAGIPSFLAVHAEFGDGPESHILGFFSFRHRLEPIFDKMRTQSARLEIRVAVKPGVSSDLRCGLGGEQCPQRWRRRH